MTDQFPEDEFDNDEPIIGDAPPEAKVLLSNRSYDVLKRTVQQVLPALGALYAGLAVFWGWPNGEEVVGSVALIATFGGVCLGLSDRQYNNSDARFDGAIDITPNEKGNSDLNVSLDPRALSNKNEVTVKVNRA